MSEWDIFLSYAREDYQAAKNLRDHLCARQTRDGRAPRVFLDVSTDGIAPGASWAAALRDGIRGSRFFVPLYSERYFAKHMCLNELQEAVELSKERPGWVIPVMMQPNLEIPLNAVHIQYLSTGAPDWAERLCAGLGLSERAQSRHLSFTATPEHAYAGLTLPALTVEAIDADGHRLTDFTGAITLHAQPGDVALEGTVALEAQAGTATFTTLSFAAPHASVTLVAEADGCERARSRPFTVAVVERGPAPPQAPVRLTEKGRPIFLPDGKALAVLGEDTLTLVAREHFPFPMASGWVRGETCLAVASWLGQVLLAGPDDATLVQLPGAVGALAFDGDLLYAGMWNGTVWLLQQGKDPELLLTDQGGVQALSVDGDLLVVGGMDGVLRVYRAGRQVAAHPIERLIHGIRRHDGCSVVVDEHNAYRLDHRAPETLIKPLPLHVSVAGAYLADELTTIIHADGTGSQFNADFAIRAGFHLAPGTRPVDADRSGRITLFEQRDGVQSLARDGRIIHTSAEGPMAVSPDGSAIALTEPDGITVVPRSALDPGMDR